MSLAPVAVVIPTYGRGLAAMSVIEAIHRCAPQPQEMWVHVDASDGIIETEIERRYPAVRILSSSLRIGPGGGRHRCLLACAAPFAVSFDDDSFPMDADFFSEVANLFAKYPDVGVFGASIWHRGETPLARSNNEKPAVTFVGCGCAIRVAAYRQVRGYLPLPLAYGMEENDVSLQLFAAGWRVFETRSLRVFHDTELSHHNSPEITAASITNIGLYAFLHYPLTAAWLALWQLANKIGYCLRMKRYDGIMAGLADIFIACRRYREFRRPMPLRSLLQFYRNQSSKGSRAEPRRSDGE